MASARYRILSLDRISPRGLEKFPPERYEVGSRIEEPDALLVRSSDLKSRVIEASVLAVGRAGVGVNTIPVGELSQRGVLVLNSPGANANAVKELVLGSLFLAARNLCLAWS